ncbi:hypothetical protein MYX77_12885, partial [Acidobacteriia bacterium AH_259_A11_L15]|nr:hypothetical protein [Acidobacteriia bacterium AH_259_A11_L15]
MPVTAYLDQNIIIDLKDKKRPEDNKALDVLTAHGQVKCVLSPWHWVEASRACDRGTAQFTAQFFDSLQALWLRERIDLETREIQAFLDGRAGDVSAIEPIVTTVGEVVRGIRGFQGHLV